MKRYYRLYRFSRRRREALTNWDAPHGCKWFLGFADYTGALNVMSVVPPRQKRRYGKIAARLNGKAVKL